MVSGRRLRRGMRRHDVWRRRRLMLWRHRRGRRRNLDRGRTNRRRRLLPRCDFRARRLGTRYRLRTSHRLRPRRDGDRRPVGFFGQCQGFDAGGADRGLARYLCACAYNIGLDHHVRWSADHQEMLNIIPAHDDQLAAAIERRAVNDSEARLTVALGGGGQRSRPKAAQEVGGGADEDQDDRKRNNELHGERELQAE
jgi:hypothetical protein